MNPDFVWLELHGGLWHTTHPERFRRILVHGAIIPEPDIPESDRWKTSNGPECYPYVRTLGGISLFDFDNFDLKTYSEQYPLSSWDYFVPYRKDWGCAVWIEIDRERVAKHLVSAAALVARWHDEKAFRHTIMPYLEAAYIGELPRTAFVRAFVVREGEQSCHPVGIT